MASQKPRTHSTRCRAGGREASRESAAASWRAKGGRRNVQVDLAFFVLGSAETGGCWHQAQGTG